MGLPSTDPGPVLTRDDRILQADRVWQLIVSMTSSYNVSGRMLKSSECEAIIGSAALLVERYETWRLNFVTGAGTGTGTGTGTGSNS